MSLLKRAWPAIISMRLSTVVKPNVTVASTKQESDLHCIQNVFKNPYDFFKTWHKEHEVPDNSLTSNALCFSTASRNGRVSSRNLILRRLDDDGFVIMTDRRSRKSKDLEENPYASMVFLWLSIKNDLTLSRQVRIEGDVKELPTEDMTDLYETEPLFCKIRAHICHQGQLTDWSELKKKHDIILENVEHQNIQLPKPDHVVAYKLFPNIIEFYEACGPKIGDRIVYVKKTHNDWESHRLAA